jgi:hypothetical protein
MFGLYYLVVGELVSHDFALVSHNLAVVLQMSAKDAEALEDDTLKLAAMASSQHVGHFRADVERWNAQLFTVADASLALTEIQHMWACLQELFSGSAEVYMCYVCAICRYYIGAI